MPSDLAVPIGLVVARERAGHPWQEYRWRPVQVVLDAPEHPGWRRLSRRRDAAQHHVARLALRLHGKEAMSYQVNLTNGEPTLYVVLREDKFPTGPVPVSVHRITASPFEAQAHSDVALDVVERVTMPVRLVEVVQGFIDTHLAEQALSARPWKAVDVAERAHGGVPPKPRESAAEIRHGSSPSDER